MRLSEAWGNLGIYRYLLIIVILLIIALMIFLFVRSGAKKNTTNNGNPISENSVTQAANDETFTCVFKTSDTPKQEIGYISDVFVAEKKDAAVGEIRVPITNVSSFKLSDFTMENEANLKQTVYFTLKGDTDRFIPGVETAIQLCNFKTDKTTVGNDLTNFYSSPTTDNTSATETSFSWVQAPKVKGQYRIDGLVKFNGGEWKLVDRLNIEFK